jgi:indolepyruvate ferredoxin oxidoreductase
MTAASVARPDVTLDDTYVADQGEVLLSRIQALVRLTLDQRRLDRQQGHETAAFVTVRNLSKDQSRNRRGGPK